MRRENPLRADDFDAPGGLTALDAFADAFTMPEDLELASPKTGLEGRVQDAHHIRGYFRKALAALGLEEAAH